MRRLSLTQARRIALGAQGFGRPRPNGRVDQRHLRRLVDDLGIIQIDSVNVLVRSQELPLFARLGPHPRNLIPAATAAGELFEYWVHEASHVPTADHRWYRWAMERPAHWGSMRRIIDEQPDYVEQVYRFIAEHGAMTAGELKRATSDAPPRRGTWWSWDDSKVALEALFCQGRVTARRRERDFARIYDLTERVLPTEVLDQPTPDERSARKELLRRAARAYGVATAADLADYHRLKVTDSKPLLAELVEDGALEAVAVDDWSQPAYLSPEVTRPRSIDARALLSPFDPVVWFRERAERLFDFHYRIEIYTPKDKRRYGYYVLPFLLGDSIVGRVDLKADRAAGRLLVQTAWIEPNSPRPMAEVASELTAELKLMAEWLELDRVAATGAGNLDLSGLMSSA